MAVLPTPNSGFPSQMMPKLDASRIMSPGKVSDDVAKVLKLRYKVQTNHYRPTAKAPKKTASECWEDNSAYAYPFDAMQRALELTKSGYPVRILDAVTDHHIGIEVPDVDPGAVEVPEHILEKMEGLTSGYVHQEPPTEG